MAWLTSRPPQIADPFFTVGFNEAWSFGIPPSKVSGSPGTGSGTVGGIAIGKKATVEVAFAVSDMEGTITEVVLGVYALHKSVGDLEFRLIHPDLTTLLLMDNRGGSGDNIGSSTAMTYFDDTALGSISGGVAPFTGRYRPESPFSVFDDKDPNGNWLLSITNDGNTAGTLQASTLLVGTTAEGIGGGASIPLVGQLWPRGNS